MHDLIMWALRHGVSAPALDELRGLLITGAGPKGAEGSENRVSSAVRLEAARHGGIVLWRNNVGALPDRNGRMVRYGLANESKEVNARIKSADLIGIYRRKIKPEDVGAVIGQFLSVETKREDWRPSNSPRDLAQFAWAAGVRAYGGIALTHASATLLAFSQFPREHNPNER